MPVTISFVILKSGNFIQFINSIKRTKLHFKTTWKFDSLNNLLILKYI